MNEHYLVKKRNKQLFVGIILVVLSVAILYYTLGVIEGTVGKLWPSLVLLAGMVLYFYYFSTRRKKNRTAVLFLATFLAVSSVPLLVMSVTTFEHMPVIWPAFVAALGIALLTVYLYGRRRKVNLWLSVLLMAASVLIWISFSLRSEFGLVIGVSMLIVGITTMTRGATGRKAEPEEGAGEKLSGEELPGAELSGAERR